MWLLSVVAMAVEEVVVVVYPTILQLHSRPLHRNIEHRNRGLFFHLLRRTVFFVCARVFFCLYTRIEVC
jgi:hypothetical protein